MEPKAKGLHATVSFLFVLDSQFSLDMKHEVISKDIGTFVSQLRWKHFNVQFRRS